MLPHKTDHIILIYDTIKVQINDKETQDDQTTHKTQLLIRLKVTVSVQTSNDGVYSELSIIQYEHTAFH